MERRKAQILILCGCIFAFIIIIITLCLSFCGLKGTFVCPEDPDQFFSFDLLKYSRGKYDLSQLDTEWIVEKGKYTISSKTIVFSPIDENSTQSTKKYTFSKIGKRLNVLVAILSTGQIITCVQLGYKLNFCSTWSEVRTISLILCANLARSKKMPTSCRK